MKKKTYVKPLLTSEEFVPQEYVAACYKINCNVPYGIGYLETNGQHGYQKGTYVEDSWFQGHYEGGDTKLGKGEGCGVYHIGVHLDTPPVENAMWQPLHIYNDKPKGEPYPVFHWSTGEDNSDQHFSKVADAEWETNPNAS